MWIYNSYSSSNRFIFRMIERRRIKQTDHVARLEGMRHLYKPLDTQSESKRSQRILE
jgi:hypothetical protein